MVVTKQTSKWFVFVAGLFVSAIPQASAQTPLTAAQATTALGVPAGATMLRYECPSGSQCPSRCTVGPNEILQTSNYDSIVIVEYPNRTMWLRLDTGQGNVDFDYVLAASDSLACRIDGATLITAAATDKPTAFPIGK
jgi:hypothetical protein